VSRPVRTPSSHLTEWHWAGLSLQPVLSIRLTVEHSLRLAAVLSHPPLQDGPQGVIQCPASRTILGEGELGILIAEASVILAS